MTDHDYYAMKSFAENRDWGQFERLLGKFPEAILFLDENRTGIVLELAGIGGAAPWIERVISLGASPSIRNNEGETAIGRSIAMDAVLNPTIENTVALLRMGADPNAITNSGNTPLVYALEMNKLGHARALIEYGADVDKETNDVFPIAAADIIRLRGRGLPDKDGLK